LHGYSSRAIRYQNASISPDTSVWNIHQNAVQSYARKHVPQTPSRMNFEALSCSQCGGPLPRQALWRMVACPQCRAMVTRSPRVVERKTFHEAWLRSRAVNGVTDRLLRVKARTYRVLATLGDSDGCEVLSAITCGPLPERVMIKLAHDGANTLAAEADVLERLQLLDLPSSAYFSQRLPQLVAFGVTNGFGDARDALVTRQPVGYWGTLDDVLAHHPNGLRDPRHAVWLWRRVLEVLAYVHGAGWTHGDVRSSHLLVNPGDHGVLLTCWGHARHGDSVARDLMQSAWAVRELLHGDSDGPPALGPNVPAPVADLLRLASEGAAWCAQHGAAEIDRKLAAAAREAFGPPRFIPFNPEHA
jgi:hypothetical protein